jgi:regulator of protease activity HflC (stomatin/prohibitin superfamily)
MFATGIVIGLALWGLYALKKSFFRVEEGHVAVLTRFGAALLAHADGKSGEGLRTFGPGLHGKLPWDHVIHVPMMEQTIDLSGQTGGRSAMADDGTVLRFDSILRYHPVEQGLSRYLFELKAPIEHITHLFTCLLRYAIANFEPSAAAQGPVDEGSTSLATLDAGGSYAVIRRERRRLNGEIEQMARSQIGDRYGVQFSAVDLADILPPDELADALNAVIHARSDADAQFFRS